MLLWLLLLSSQVLAGAPRQWPLYEYSNDPENQGRVYFVFPPDNAPLHLSKTYSNQDSADNGSSSEEYSDQVQPDKTQPTNEPKSVISLDLGPSSGWIANIEVPQLVSDGGVEQVEQSGCTCVPYYRCNNGSVNTDGTGLLDIR